VHASKVRRIFVGMLSNIVLTFHIKQNIMNERIHNRTRLKTGVISTYKKYNVNQKY